MPPNLDSQQIESLGRAALTAALVGDGLEVAQPTRDAGIDLLAFTVKPWKVIPIQMKVATGAGFSVQRKYDRIPNLVMVYIWNARSADQVEFYAMSFRDARRIAGILGWTKTASWRKGGGYTTTRPSRRVKEAIAQHRMSPGRWRRLLRTA